MIYITGDTHSCFNRFTKRNFPKQAELTKKDYVIIAGGGFWWLLVSGSGHCPSKS